MIFLLLCHLVLLTKFWDPGALKCQLRVLNLFSDGYLVLSLRGTGKLATLYNSIPRAWMFSFVNSKRIVFAKKF